MPTKKSPTKPKKPNTPMKKPTKTAVTKASSARKASPKSAAVAIQLPTKASVALTPGAAAPSFALPGDDGQTHALADHRGQRVVLYFYPKDDTPGCTLEAHQFRQASAEFAKRKTLVFGVSRDSIASHCKFRDKHALNFTLLSDPEAKTISAYGAWGEKNMYGNVSMGTVRTTVIIDAAGKVQRVFPRVKVAEHVAAVLAALDA